jgi:hypothetical protein
MNLWTKRLKIIGGVALGLMAAIQLVPVDRTHPDTTGSLSAPAPVQSVLERSCYDCHSHETQWPWYSYVAPVSWLIAHDVHEGRGKLNFSEWESHSERVKSYLTEKILEEVEAGEMPVLPYLLLHPKARVTPTEIEALKLWANSVLGVEPGKPDTEDSHESPAL